MGVSYEELWKKSQIFIERAIDKRNEGNNEEFHFWASITLELLGKATLAQIHPSLVVDPTTPKGLLIACGYSKGEDYKTITAKTVFERLKNLINVKRFDEDTKKFCMRLANMRNSELHSGETPFIGMMMESWLPKFWDTCSMLLDHQGKTLEEFIGSREAMNAKEIINDKTIILRKNIESMLNKHRDDIVERFGGDILEHVKMSKISWIEENQKIVQCPSCNAEAVITGDVIEEGDIDTDPDDPWIFYQEVTYEATSFYCRTCGLTLDNLDELAAADIDQEFTNNLEVEPDYEADYGND